VKRRSSPSALTESQEDYLKQIFLLGESGDSVTTQSLSDRLGVRPASVTGMVRRLAELGLVDHRRYHGFRLTDSGRQVALELLRHHRLLETFLVESLGYGWGEVHAEAERLEHVISERFEARIAEALGHPTHDPHGDPIPDSQLRLPRLEGESRLSRVTPPVRGTVVRVTAQDTDRLTVLEGYGLIPGTRVEVCGASAESIDVAVADRDPASVPLALAEEVWLKECYR
jgi:DtxR family Mn-dependent transcriptional regulator